LLLRIMLVKLNMLSSFSMMSYIEGITSPVPTFTNKIKQLFIKHYILLKKLLGHPVNAFHCAAEYIR
jgi:hypothetical protein